MTRAMIDSLRRLGIEVDHDSSTHQLVVAGQGGELPNSNAEMFIGNSGTTIRFLTALLGLSLIHI